MVFAETSGKRQPLVVVSISICNYMHALQNDAKRVYLGSLLLESRGDKFHKFQKFCLRSVKVYANDVPVIHR